MEKKFYGRKNARKYADKYNTVILNEPPGTGYKYRIEIKDNYIATLNVPSITFEKFISNPPNVDNKLFNLWLDDIKLKYSNHDLKTF